MDKKSFIRGFGLGVIFATFILGASCMIRTSDAAIVKRAKQLGMEYAQQEEELFRKKGSASGAAISKQDMKETSAPSSSEKPKKPKETKKPSKKLSEEESNRNELEREKAQMRKEFEDTAKEFTIQAGDWSSDVSRKLEDMNIISDAAAFDAYLEKNGYSDNIKAGTFSIPKDASFEEIAKEITSK